MSVRERIETGAVINECLIVVSQDTITNNTSNNQQLNILDEFPIELPCPLSSRDASMSNHSKSIISIGIIIKLVI